MEGAGRGQRTINAFPQNLSTDMDACVAMGTDWKRHHPRQLPLVRRGFEATFIF